MDSQISSSINSPQVSGTASYGGLFIGFSIPLDDVRMPKIPKGCGIYAIINLIDNKIYIGQSIRVNIRLNQHRVDLNCGRGQAHLQRAYIKYGPKAFLCVVLLTCLEDELNHWEKYFITKYDTLDDKFGYNFYEVDLNHKRNIEGAQKRSQNAQTRSRSRSKLNWDKVNHIRALYSSGDSSRKIARDLGISQRVVYYAAVNKTWHDPTYQHRTHDPREIAVIDTTTGVIYLNLSQAAVQNNFSRSRLYTIMNLRKSGNYTPFRYA